MLIMKQQSFIAPAWLGKANYSPILESSLLKFSLIHFLHKSSWYAILLYKYTPAVPSLSFTD